MSTEPTTATTMPQDQADWIAQHVVPRTYVKSCGGIKLVRLCQCQYGQCGHCGAGSHGKCPTRAGFAGKSPAGVATHIVGRKGVVVADVWPSGKACRWVCSCAICPKVEAKPVSDEKPRTTAFKAGGDLRRGDTVWLIPKTLGCPSICWKRPQATVVGAGDRIGAFVRVKVGRKTYEVHIDNVRRSNPHAAKSVRMVRSRPRPTMPEGYSEQTLF